MNYYEEMVKEAYEDILDSFEKEAKKKEDDKEKVYDTPLGKRHIVKGALKGALMLTPGMALAGAGYGGLLGGSGVHTGFGKTWEEAAKNAKRQGWIDAGKGAGVGSLAGAGVGLGLGVLAGAKGASNERKLSQLSVERQKALIEMQRRANDRYNAAVKKGYKNNEREYADATNDLNTAIAEYHEALKEGKQILKNKKINKK